MRCIKSRHHVLESNFSLWHSTSTDHRPDKIKMVYGQFLHFHKNYIACAFCWIPACVMVFPLAVMAPVFFTSLFCSKEKIVANCYTFKWMILQHQFKSNKEIELPSLVYTRWLFLMAMSMRWKNMLK